MVLLIATVHGVNYEMISRILESCGRCKRGNKINEYKNYLDVHKIKGLLKYPIVFDITYDNFKVRNKNFPEVKKLIIPCRPDLIWDEIQFYKNPQSAFFNRMTRLKEMARQPNSLTIPFESLGTYGALKSLENFLGVGKNILPCEWMLPDKEINCPMIKKYNNEINKMVSLSSWHQKSINTV